MWEVQMFAKTYSEYYVLISVKPCYMMFESRRLSVPHTVSLSTTEDRSSLAERGAAEHPTPTVRNPHYAMLGRTVGGCAIRIILFDGVPKIQAFGG